MNVDKFWSKVDRSGECWVWTGGRNSDGYGNCHMPIDGRLKSQKAHRAAWRLTRGDIPQGMSVLHRCDNPPCVNPDHLFLGTQADNMRDCREKGRYSHKSGRVGSHHQNARLKESDIPNIRALRAKGETFKSIAFQYGVSDSTIHNIFNGHTWGHVA